MNEPSPFDTMLDSPESDYLVRERKPSRFRPFLYILFALLVVLGCAYGVLCYTSSNEMAVGNRIVWKNEIDSYKGVFDTYITEPYFRSRLSGQEQALYDAYHYAYENGADQFEIRGRYSQEQIDKVLYYYKCDYPNVSVSTGETQLSDEADAGPLMLKLPMGIELPIVKFPMVPRTRIYISAVELDDTRRNADALQKAHKIIEDMPDDLTSEFDRAKYIYDYLIRNVVYREGDGLDTDSTVATMYGALVEDEANCDGFASAITLLFQMEGIECFKAFYTGADLGQQVGHAWNIAKIDGNYYHLDASYDAPLNQDLSLDADITLYNKFCITEEEAVRNEGTISPIIAEIIPDCTTKALREKLYDVVIDEDDFDEISALAADGMVEKLSDGEGYLTIKFDDSAQFKAFNDNFAGDGYGSQILERMDQDTVATLTNTYQDVFDTILLHYQED